MEWICVSFFKFVHIYSFKEKLGQDLMWDMYVQNKK